MMRMLSKSWARASSLLLVLLALGLCTAQVGIARADEHAEAEAEAGGHGHGGQVHLSDVFRSTEFWGSVINFTLLVWVLRRLGKKPLSDFLTNRRAEMEREISAAAEARAKAEAKYQEYSARMAQLDTELAKLRADLERGAQEDKARILAEAEETARRLRRETESLIDQHAKSLSANIRREIVNAAMARAEVLLRESVTEADQERLARGYVTTLNHEASGPSAGGQARSAQPQEQS